MKLIRSSSLFLLFVFSSFITFSQKDTVQSFSLKEAQEYAVLNSYKTQTSSLDVEFAKKQVKQYTSVGLPQISANGKFNYYVDIPTSLMPDFISPAIDGVLLAHGLITPSQMLPMGDAQIPVQFGSKYNFSADATLTQLIFDGTYIVGLKVAKVYVDMTKTNQLMTQQEIRETVTQTYYLVLIAQENRNILDSSIISTRNALYQTKEYNKNGFNENTDVDQLTLVLTNLENRMAAVDRQIDVAYSLLKFQMGLDINNHITLTDNLDALLNQAIAANLIDKEFDPKNHIAYKLVETGNYINKLQYKMDRYKYMPTLVGFGTISYNAQRSKFDFFKSGSDYPWYRTTILGLQLSVPIWSSGSRYYKIQMDKFTIKKNELQLKQLEQGLSMDVQNSRADLRTFTDQYQSEIKNMDLARRIYLKTLVKYREGVSTSMELTQAHNQYLATQGNYFNTIFALLTANSKLNKALNNY